VVFKYITLIQTHRYTMLFLCFSRYQLRSTQQRGHQRITGYVRLLHGLWQKAVLGKKWRRDNSL